MTINPTIWSQVKDWLKGEIGEDSFQSWIAPLELDFTTSSGFQVNVIVPTRFMHDWVLRHYSDLIKRGLSQALDGDVQINLSVKTAEPVAPQVSQPAPQPHAQPAPQMPEAQPQQPMYANGFPQAEQAMPQQPQQFPSQPHMQQPGMNPHMSQPHAQPHMQQPQQHMGFNQPHMQQPQQPAAPAPQPIPQHATTPSAANAGGIAYQGNPLDPRFTFNNFVTGKSNEFAYAAAKRIAESADIAYNPFILHGGVGLGKTHLMHAIAWHIQQFQPGRRVMYISAEKFLHNFISALKNKNTHNFKDTFRNVDVLMIDDVQFIAGKEATQEEFFHTFEALVSERKQIILTADKSPHEMQGIEDRLRSRLGWGLATEIHKPDLETRLAILDQKAQSLGIEVNKSVAMMLASKIESNVRELEGALNRLAAHATLVQQEINVESATELLRDLFRHVDREVPISEIQKKVAEYYNIKVSDMSSSRRSRAVARPRQVAMYLSKSLTSKSFPEIGKAFGGRDHTTVMHAAKTIENLNKTDAGMAEDISLLENILRND